MSIEGINFPSESEAPTSEIVESEAKVSEESGAESQVNEAKIEEKDPFSSKFAALSRKEKELRMKERDLERKLLELEDQIKQGPSKQEAKSEESVSKRDLEYRLKSDPLKTLEELGLPYSLLSKIVLEEGNVPAELKMDLMKSDLEKKYEEKIKSLEEKYTQFESKQQEERSRAEVQNFEKEINNFVESNSDKYELIKANNAQDWVRDTIAKHYQETSIFSKDGRMLKGGEILSISEASDLVESYLDEELEKHLSLNKVKNRIKPAEQPKKQAQAPQTLTNSQGTSVPNRHDKLLPREESLKLAASMLKWNT